MKLAASIQCETPRGVSLFLLFENDNSYNESYLKRGVNVMNVMNLTATIVFIFSLAAISFSQTDFEKGVALYENSDNKGAVELFKNVSETKGAKDARAERFLGMSYARLEKHNLARKAFKRADKLKRRKSDKTFKHYKVLYRVYARHTKEPRSNRIQGEVRLAVEFLKDGSIGLIYPYKKLPFGLTKNVVDAVRKIEFEPAMRDGEQITVIGVVSYRFSFS